MVCGLTHGGPVQQRGHALHGGCDTHSEVMDELATAAAVLAMDVESDAEESSDLEVGSDVQDGRDEQRGDFEVPAMGKENDPGHPDTGVDGAAHPKVMAALFTPRALPHVPLFARWPSPIRLSRLAGADGGSAASG